MAFHEKEGMLKEDFENVGEFDVIKSRKLGRPTKEMCVERELGELCVDFVVSCKPNYISPTFVQLPLS